MRKAARMQAWGRLLCLRQRQPAGSDRLRPRQPGSRTYQNNGDGSFTYSSYVSGVAAATLLHSGWGLAFLDYDNDGWKDLIVAQGHDMDNIQLTSPQLRYKEPMLLMHNNGKSFVDVSAASGEVFHEAWAGRGLSAGDIWNDGRMDVVVTTNSGPAYILRNELLTPNHWLGIKLVGHKSNRDGIGAEIKVTTSKGTQFVDRVHGG